MAEPTRGEVEAALANAITQFEKDQMGRGPVETRAFIIEDTILVRLRGVLTPAEIKLAQNPDGHALIKQLRRQLLEGSDRFWRKSSSRRRAAAWSACTLISALKPASG